MNFARPLGYSTFSRFRHRISTVWDSKSLGYINTARCLKLTQKMIAFGSMNSDIPERE